MEVRQGWVSPAEAREVYSEAVLVQFDPELIALATLVKVHLHTHSCTSMHSMRSKYRSAVYVFDDVQAEIVRLAIQDSQQDFADNIITEVLPFGDFKLNTEEFLDYYYRNPDKPFCTTYIDPKLRIIMEQFSGSARPDLGSMYEGK